MKCDEIQVWQQGSWLWIEVGGTVWTVVSNDVVLHESTEMQQMMQLTISEAQKECNEDTTCDDPIFVQE